MKVMSVLNLRPRKLGSFEEYTISLSRSLAGQGGQSVLVFKELPPDSLIPAFRDSGAILETNAFAPFPSECTRSLCALVRRYRPDVVHFHFVDMLSFDLLAVRMMRRVRCVFSAHWSDIPHQQTALRGVLSRAAKRTFASCVDRFIAPSEYVHDRLVRSGIAAGKVTTIRNGVNLERFCGAGTDRDIRARYGLKPGGMIVVSVSQLIPEKGIGHLIDAAAQVIQRGADVSFVHVGDGVCAEEYRARIRQLGIGDRFLFTGLLNLAEISSILNQSDVFVLPCTWGEAFSLALLEAIAARLPAIATRTGGNSEAVEDGRNGLLVPPRDAAALAGAILALYDDPGRRRRMAQEAERRRTDFSIERWVDQTIELYRRLAS